MLGWKSTLRTLTLLSAALPLLAAPRPLSADDKPAVQSADALNTLTDAEKSAGWKLLFDGKTTAGWRGYKKDKCPEGWQVVDGTLAP